MDQPTNQNNRLLRIGDIVSWREGKSDGQYITYFVAGFIPDEPGMVVLSATPKFGDGVFVADGEHCRILRHYLTGEQRPYPYQGGVCPLCETPITNNRATSESGLSRYDDKTEMCWPCVTQEAFAAWVRARYIAGDGQYW